MKICSTFYLKINEKQYITVELLLEQQYYLECAVTLSNKRLEMLLEFICMLVSNRHTL